MANDKGELIAQLLDRMNDVEPLADEKTFFTNTQTLARFLKARDWNLSDAERQLRATVEWRRTTRPLQADCMWCHEQPGYHGIRQVGFDETGRPVIYACFAQASARHTSVEDTVAHSVFLVENAYKTMAPGVNTWVFIIDCTGMTLQACNPRIGYGVTQILADNYPELLGLVICINHSPIFQSVWNAIKVFLHANTVEKMHLIRSKKKVRATFEKHLGEELTSWLLEEIRLNKEKHLTPGQREFWRAPPSTVTDVASPTPVHDARGCPSYVSRYIDRYFDIPADISVATEDGGVKQMSSSSTDTSGTVAKNQFASKHHPHPNIIDALCGVGSQPDQSSLQPQPNNHCVNSGTGSKNSKDGCSGATGNGFNDEGSSSEEEDVAEGMKTIEIGEEYQVEKDKVSNIKM